MTSYLPQQYSRSDGPFPVAPSQSHAHFWYRAAIEDNASTIPPVGRLYRDRPQRRLIRSCKHCRRRKARCDGIEPHPCTRCAKLGRPCEYVDVLPAENVVLREKKRACKQRRLAEQAQPFSRYQESCVSAYPPYRNTGANFEANCGVSSSDLNGANQKVAGSMQFPLLNSAWVGSSMPGLVDPVPEPDVVDWQRPMLKRTHSHSTSSVSSFGSARSPITVSTVASTAGDAFTTADYVESLALLQATGASGEVSGCHRKENQDDTAMWSSPFDSAAVAYRPVDVQAAIAEVGSWWGNVWLQTQ